MYERSRVVSGVEPLLCAPRQWVEEMVRECQIWVAK